MWNGHTRIFRTSLTPLLMLLHASLRSPNRKIDYYTFFQLTTVTFVLAQLRAGLRRRKVGKFGFTSWL